MTWPWKKPVDKRASEMKEACQALCDLHNSRAINDQQFLSTMAYVMVRDDECLNLIFKGVQAQKDRHLEYISDANNMLSQYAAFANPHEKTFRKKLITTTLWDNMKEFYVKWGRKELGESRLFSNKYRAKGLDDETYEATNPRSA